MHIKAGLDFGTTTSILSFMEGDTLKSFKYGGETDSGTPYIPTAVAYFEEDLLIGPYAVEYSDEATLHRFFKMELPLDQSAGKGPSAQDLTADFIGELIRGTSPGRARLAPQTTNKDSFQKFHSHEIQSLFVSVPHVWKDEAVLGRQHLQEVLHDVLGFPSVKLISEPVAAAAFFSHSYRKRNHGAAYSGNLLVCDMGGGTFDVTLCRLKPGRVEVLCNAGNGAAGFGLAGMHFDRSLIEICCGDKLSEREWVELLYELDREKKKQSKRGGQNLFAQCLKGMGHQQPFYSLSHSDRIVRITFEPIRRAFEPVRQGIFQVLGDVRAQAEASNESIDKVILVGGFSKFPLVQHAVCEFFDEDMFGERRLIDPAGLNTDEMAFAISYGACLVANEVITVSERYEHTIGVVVTHTSGRDVELELVSAGKHIDQLTSPQFGRREDGQSLTFKLAQPRVEFQLFMRRAGGRSEQDRFVRTLVLGEVPNFSRTNSWTLGARVDYSKVPYLTLKDKNQGREYEYRLAELFPEFVEGVK
jgi:molecular chaperone DnaK